MARARHSRHRAARPTRNRLFARRRRRSTETAPAPNHATAVELAPVPDQPWLIDEARVLELLEHYTLRTPAPVGRESQAA